jgi:hypothetical protein
MMPVDPDSRPNEKGLPMEERQVRSLVRWNCFWLCLFLLFALVKAREAVQSNYQRVDD